MASIINAGTTSNTALNMSADTSGTLDLQSNGTTMASVTSTGFNIGGAVASGFTMKNRIINGDMVISQRNGTNAVTTPDVYTVDRWQQFAGGGGVISWQQSSIAPTGFENSLSATVTTPDTSLGTSDYYFLRQFIEGFNVADLAWGTANARTVTLSFWVRSSLTGTFGGCLQNGGTNRFYPFTYTISAANTWEQKSVTIPGDTTGTWLKTNGAGLGVTFALGFGTNFIGTANAWTSSSFWTATGSTNVVGTNGATWYITGVQLERGSQATSFEWLPYGTELALCQRYYEKSYNIDVSPTTNTTTGIYNASGSSDAGSNIIVGVTFAVSKRASPTVTGYTNTGTSGQWGYNRNGASGYATVTIDRIGTYSFRAYTALGAAWAVGNTDGHWVASAEL